MTSNRESRSTDPPSPAQPRAEGHEGIPMMAPRPPRLSEHAEALRTIEVSGLYTNYGPTNTHFETTIISSLFHEGACVTVCNATIGLILAIREAIGEERGGSRRYALMPSFTFAATGQAALWNGLTPLFRDIDLQTWLPCSESEQALLSKYKGEIAVVVPYATFGNNLDLRRYEQLSVQHDVPIVIDAAASLGSIDTDGKQFGSGFPWSVVFSMHATKLFSVGEGGIVYCADESRIARLRSMGSFGFEGTRSATQIGLNSKLSEVAALTALLQLERLDSVVKRRLSLSEQYMQELVPWHRQRRCGQQQAYAFESVLLPESLCGKRDQIMSALLAKGIGCASYFSPHLAEQPYFQKHGHSDSLPATHQISQRILTLPMFDDMSHLEVLTVCRMLEECCSDLDEPTRDRVGYPVPSPPESTLIP